MFLFISIAISVGNLNYDYSIVNSHPPTEVAPPGGGNFYMGPYLTWLTIGVLYTLIIVAIVGALLLRKKLGKSILEDIIGNFIALIILLGGVFALLFLANKISISTSSKPVQPAGGFPIGVVIFYASFILLIGILFYAVLRNLKRKEKGEKVEEKEIKKYVEQAIYTVQLGDDVRSAILRAYKEMENMIHAIRASEKKHYTPREFEDFVLKNFEISEDPVKRLVSLFETARYSKHEMREEDRKNAISALEAIRHELS